MVWPLHRARDATAYYNAVHISFPFPVFNLRYYVVSEAMTFPKYLTLKSKKDRTNLTTYSAIHISKHPSKELCSKMAPEEVGVSLP